MIISNAHASPNFSSDIIPVEFAVLHYTAADLKGTLDIFANATSGVTAHFVIAEDGLVHDLGGFLGGPIRRGAHAGLSRLVLNGREHTALNHCSVGIELVNRNGNLFDYPEAQYAALIELLRRLASRFSALNQPGRIVGHEHIAGFRGKCDPGRRFDWPRTLGELNSPILPLHSQFVFGEKHQRMVDHFLTTHPSPNARDWIDLSSGLEALGHDQAPLT